MFKKNNNYNYPNDIETGLKPSSPNEYYLICQKCNNYFLQNINKTNYTEDCSKCNSISNKKKFCLIQ